MNNRDWLVCLSADVMESESGNGAHVMCTNSEIILKCSTGKTKKSDKRFRSLVSH